MPSLNSEQLVYYPRRKGEGRGYDDPTSGPGWLCFYNIKDLLARFFVSIHSGFGKIDNWREYCIGVVSIHQGRGHTPMLDYDGKDIKTLVKKDIERLQDKFKLGDATLYTTRKGIHVYFFSDLVSWDTYREVLSQSKCCKGFRRACDNRGYSVLRVSAKYTLFDIEPYTVMKSPHTKGRRPGQKAAIVKELLRLGQECGTHFMSLYPQWGHYEEDVVPWRTGAPPKKQKRLRKAPGKKSKHIFKTDSGESMVVSVTIPDGVNTQEAPPLEEVAYDSYLNSTGTNKVNWSSDYIKKATKIVTNKPTGKYDTW
jgi:hypothetical protein